MKMFTDVITDVLDENRMPYYLNDIDFIDSKIQEILMEFQDGFSTGSSSSSKKHLPVDPECTSLILESIKKAIQEKKIAYSDELISLIHQSIIQDINRSRLPRF